MKKENNGLHTLRIDANKAWKEDMFSISGLCKYVQSGTNKDLNLLIEKIGLKPDVITVDFLLKNATPKLLVCKDGSKKQKFSLWFVSGTLLKFHSEICAKAATSQPVKIETEKKPETTKTENRTNAKTAKKAA